MGGDIKAITGTNNFTKAADDLDIVYCSVDLIWGNIALFDRSILFEKFNMEAAKYFKENGVKYKKEGPASLGGGAGFLLDVIKQLWASKAIVGIIIVLVKWVFRFIIKPKFDEKPRVCVSLRIKTDSNLKYVENASLEGMLINRLVNLKNLNDGLCEVLEKKYPIFKYDQLVRATLPAKSFRARFLIKHEHRNNFNRLRLMNLFKGLKIKSNIEKSYHFNNFYFVERFDRKNTYKNRTWIGDKKSSRYFLVVSSRIINDYF